MGIYINDFISNIKIIFYILKYKLFKMDCSAAPFNYYVDQMKNEIKYQSQKILSKIEILINKKLQYGRTMH